MFGSEQPEMCVEIRLGKKALPARSEPWKTNQRHAKSFALVPISTYGSANVKNPVAWRMPPPPAREQAFWRR
jgi:hypothetical protein